MASPILTICKGRPSDLEQAATLDHESEISTHTCRPRAGLQASRRRDYRAARELIYPLGFAGSRAAFAVLSRTLCATPATLHSTGA